MRRNKFKKRNPSPRESSFSKFENFSIITSIISIILAAGSPILVTHLNNQFNVEKQQIDYKYQMKKRQLETQDKVVDKRIELIEKTSKLVGQAAGVSDLFRTYIKNIDNPEKEMSEKLAKYNGEYYSVISMDQIYFGPETQKAINELSKEDGAWWNKSKDKYNNLLSSMYGEIYYEINEDLDDIE